MNKTLIRILIVCMICLLLCGCGKKDQTPAMDGGTQPSGASEPAGEEVPTDETQETGETTGTEPTQTTDSTQETPATEQTQPSGELDYSEELYFPEDEFFMDEMPDFGTGPQITVKLETYENMSDAEKQAYEACFSNSYAFDEWMQMALMDHETSMNEDMLVEFSNLNLKEIIETLVGEEIA